MLTEKKIRKNLIAQKVSFVFVALLYASIAVGCIYFIVRSNAYGYEVFWVAAFAELVLLLLFFKMPNRGVYGILRLLIWFLALIGPQIITASSPSYKPAGFAMFVFFLGVVVVGSPNIFRHCREDIRKVEEQLSRIKAGLPVEDEIQLKVSTDETVKLQKRFNTFIERTYTVKGIKTVIGENIQNHFQQSGYKQVSADTTTVFTRGRGPNSFGPKDWLSMAAVRVIETSEGVIVELWLGVDLKGQIVMPWEKAFWKAELRDFEKTLTLTDSFRESENANQKAIWLNVAMVLIYLLVIIAVPVVIILSIMYIVEERFPDSWGIAGLVFIAVLVLAVVSWLRKRTKVLW